MNNASSSNYTDYTASVTPASLQFSVGVIGNLLALIILVKNSAVHKWRPFYRLVLGLVITDFSAILLIFPIIIARYGSKFTFIYSQDLCHYLSFVSSFTPLSSAMIVTAMSAERFVAVIFPFHYSRNDGRKGTLVTLIIIWFVSGLICSLHVFGFGNARLFYPGTWCFLDFLATDLQNKINSLIYCVAGTIMLVVTFILNTSVVYYLLWKYKCTKTNRGRLGDRNDALGYTIGMLMTIVIIFFICWVPILIRIIFNVALEYRNESGDVLAARLAISNSILDPWVYILARRDILGTFCNKIRRRRGNVSGVEISMTSVGTSVEKV